MSEHIGITSLFQSFHLGPMPSRNPILHSGSFLAWTQNLTASLGVARAQYLCSEPGGRGGGGSKPWWRHPDSAPQDPAWAEVPPRPILFTCWKQLLVMQISQGSGAAAAEFEVRAVLRPKGQGSVLEAPCRPRIRWGDCTLTSVSSLSLIHI